MQMVIRIQTPAYQLDADGLIVPGYDQIDTPGAPALPVRCTVVELPATGEWSITVEPSEARLLSVERPLPAVPIPMPDLPQPNTWSHERVAGILTMDHPDPAVYGADAFYPDSLVQASPVQWQRGKRLLSLRVFPFQYNPVAGQLRFHPDLRITVRVDSTAGLKAMDARRVGGTTVGAAPLNLASQPRATGGSLRIRTASRGMTRLTYADLAAADPRAVAADPATFVMSYLGQPIDIQVTDADEDGQFDSADMVIFYAEPYQGRYMTQNVYWFTYGDMGGARMATRMVTPTGGESLVTEITSTLHVEQNRDYRPGYDRPKDIDHYFDTQLYSNSSMPVAVVTYTLALNDPVTTTGQVGLQVLIHGGVNQGIEPDQSVALRLNNHPAGAFSWSGSTDYTATVTLPASWLDGAPNKIGLEASLSQLPGLTYYWISPDWVELTYPAVARAQTDRLYIEAAAPGANEMAVAGFTTPHVRVYDLRDSRHPVQITGTLAAPDGATYTMHFWDEALPGPTYWLGSDVALLAPAAVEADTPSDWRAPDHAADYIAIVHRSLWTAIDPLLSHRADPSGDNLRVAKVDVQDIYDEFSAGRVDPEAIRTFLTYAYDNWNSGSAPPEYVLLVGDGDFDFYRVSGTTLLNLIPPYLVNVDPWLGETASDNRFVSVDGPNDFLPDMHIGRIPAQTPADVTIAVDKILAYEQTAPAGDWQRRVIYVADNCADAAGDFHQLSDDVRLNWLPSGYDDRPIYYGSTTACPESNYSTEDGMRSAIKTAFNNQALLLQWFGHASKYRWGSVSMLNIYDPSALAANNVWPVTMAFSCWSGYFIDIYNDWQSLGERLLLTSQRGSVADLSPSGLHVDSALAIMNQGLTQAIFQDHEDRFGGAVDAAKLYYFAHASSFLDVIDTSVAFGDPALRLRLPTFVSITSDGSNAVLTWEHLPQYASYEVWRTTQPYFSASDVGSEKRGEVLPSGSGADLVFEDAGALGDPDANYFYVVQGVAPGGAPGVSSRTGVFGYALVSGD